MGICGSIEDTKPTSGGKPIEDTKRTSGGKPTEKRFDFRQWETPFGTRAHNMWPSNASREQRGQRQKAFSKRKSDIYDGRFYTSEYIIPPEEDIMRHPKYFKKLFYPEPSGTYRYPCYVEECVTDEANNKKYKIIYQNNFYQELTTVVQRSELRYRVKKRFILMKGDPKKWQRMVESLNILKKDLDKKCKLTRDEKLFYEWLMGKWKKFTDAFLNNNLTEHQRTRAFRTRGKESGKLISCSHGALMAEIESKMGDYNLDFKKYFVNPEDVVEAGKELEERRRKAKRIDFPSCDEPFGRLGWTKPHDDATSADSESDTDTFYPVTSESDTDPAENVTPECDTDPAETVTSESDTDPVEPVTSDNDSPTEIRRLASTDPLRTPWFLLAVLLTLLYSILRKFVITRKDASVNADKVEVQLQVIRLE